jgi:hypothetical protein
MAYEPAPPPLPLPPSASPSYGRPPQAPIAQYWAARPAAPLRHSGLGVASFVLGLLTAIAIPALFATVVAIEMNTPGWIDQETPGLMALCLGILLAAVLALLGAILGIGGTVQRDRKKVFAVIGLVLNGAVALGVAALLVLGMMTP